MLGIHTGSDSRSGIGSGMEVQVCRFVLRFGIEFGFEVWVLRLGIEVWVLRYWYSSSGILVRYSIRFRFLVRYDSDIVV